jgi:hypothetical protein
MCNQQPLQRERPHELGLDGGVLIPGALGMVTRSRIRYLPAVTTIVARPREHS